MGRTYAMSKYQITLTPVDKFFFGGEMTFKIEGKESFNEQYSSYIIRSSMFPQQTSLLGMLRFLILRHDKIAFNGINITDEVRANKLIGSQSFSVNDNHHKNFFGKIESLSHVRVRRIIGGNVDGKACGESINQYVDLDFAPLFEDVNFEGASVGKYNFEQEIMHKVSIPNLSKEEYNAKEGLDLYLTDGIKKYSLKEIFLEDRRIGVNRDIYTGKTADGALFKQISYRFCNKKTKWCFVFDAEVDIDNLEDLSGELVTVGGDNSQFVINISKKIIRNNDIASLKNAVYLLSPTFLTRDEARKAKFAVTKLMSFRFLESQIYKDSKSYHIIGGKMRRSQKYELYAPASVFYFDDDDQKQEFIKCLEDKKEFRQIGYNEYK